MRADVQGKMIIMICDDDDVDMAVVRPAASSEYGTPSAGCLTVAVIRGRCPHAPAVLLWPLGASPLAGFAAGARLPTYRRCTSLHTCVLYMCAQLKSDGCPAATQALLGLWDLGF